MIISQLNFEKLVFKPELLLQVKHKELFFPLHATVSLTNYCNHKCLWCTVYEYQQDKAKYFETDKLIGYIKNANKHGLAAVTYVGNGEPVLHPDFKKITEEFGECDIEQGIFTNGSKLRELTSLYLKYFSFVRFSLDAFDNDSHKNSHGVEGQFEPIIKEIKDMTKEKKKIKSDTQIGIQYVFHNVNYQGLYQIAEIAKNAEVDYLSFKPAFNRGAIFVRGTKNKLTLDEIYNDIARAKIEFEDDDFKIFFREFQIKSIDKNILKYKNCYAGLFNILIYEDESIIYCGPKRIKIGSINDDPLKTMHEINENHLKISLQNCPGGCRYHSLNRLMFLLLNPEKRKFFNENFI